MHSFKGTETVWHYNQDFSGHITINDNKTGTPIVIPAKDILDFVAECYVKPNKIESIEKMETDHLLLNEPLLLVRNKL